MSDDLVCLADDPGRLRRTIIALALAIAITAAGALIATRTWPQASPAPERIVAATVVLERAVPTPTPAPRRTPAPTTPPTLARVTPAPPQRAGHATGGTSAAAPRALHPVVHRTVTRPATLGASGVDVAAGLGAGTGSGNGTGDDAGSGSGDGAGGNGAGAVNADLPCGYVEFVPDERPRIVGNVSYETIRATVHYPDGHTASDDFPYPWVYADYMDTDPWSPINIRRTDLVVPAQLPPPGSDPHRFPEIVRYVLDHTSSNGMTVLQPCPR